MNTKNYSNDKRVVLTLDAGGTNFVFAAIRGNELISSPIIIGPDPNDLNKCLKIFQSGFSRLIREIKERPKAISFAFPGPANYPLGIIENPPNLPCFAGGVALGPMLKDQFGIPVFINNDGDLFVYGEAIAGFLPYVNNLLEKNNSTKRYRNLFGITLGTGFGGGFSIDGELFLGDNSGGAEIWLMRNKKLKDSFAEQTSNIEAVKRVYKELSKSQIELEPKDIYEIAVGKQEGSKEAAIESFRHLGESVGDALANAITLLDGLIVIGGGMSAASEFILPSLVKEMNSEFINLKGKKLKRLESEVFNLEDEMQLDKFIKGEEKEISVPFSDNKISYDALRRIGVGISKLGTTEAVAIGAYTFALNKLDKNN